MNYIIENMKSRRSVRSYLEQAVPNRLIEEMLEAARYAPSALNKQPWEFVVVTNRPLIRELSSGVRKIMKKLFAGLPLLKFFSAELRDERAVSAIKKTASSDGDTVFYDAPALIFIVSSKAGKWTGTDCALAAQNILLAAHSLGLGGCFIGRGMFVGMDRRLSRLIGLKRPYKIYATIAVGYPKEFSKIAPERKKDNLVCWRG